MISTGRPWLTSYGMTHQQMTALPWVNESPSIFSYERKVPLRFPGVAVSPETFPEWQFPSRFSPREWQFPFRIYPSESHSDFPPNTWQSPWRFSSRNKERHGDVYEQTFVAGSQRLATGEGDRIGPVSSQWTLLRPCQCKQSIFALTAEFSIR